MTFPRFDADGLRIAMSGYVPRNNLPREGAGRKPSDRTDEFRMYTLIEELTPDIIRSKHRAGPVCANIDPYSGFAYDLGIPYDLYTPCSSSHAAWDGPRIVSKKSSLPTKSSVPRNMPVSERYGLLRTTAYAVAALWIRIGGSNVFLSFSRISAESERPIKHENPPARKPGVNGFGNLLSRQCPARSWRWLLSRIRRCLRLP